MIVSVHSSRNLEHWEREARSGSQPSLAPYGLEHLARRGFELRQASPPAWFGRRGEAGLRAVEARARLTLRPTLLAAPTTRGSDIALALLEPQGYAYSLLAAMGMQPWSRTPLAVLSCWLTDDFRIAGTALKGWLRRCVRGTDLFVFWSRNQQEVLCEQLGIPEERLCFVHFGIEKDFFVPRTSEPDEPYVIAAGLDRGRDYRTFLSAVRGLDHKVRLVCRRSRLRGLEVPPNVEVMGLVAKTRYRDLLRDAALVVIPVRPEVSYPTGQTELLVAMSSRIPSVVTRTEPLSDYVRHAENAWTVPGEDAEALREGIELLLRDGELAERIARAGYEDVQSRFNTEAMWESLAPRLRALGEARS